MKTLQWNEKGLKISDRDFPSDKSGDEGRRVWNLIVLILSSKEFPEVMGFLRDSVIPYPCYDWHAQVNKP